MRIRSYLLAACLAAPLSLPGNRVAPEVTSAAVSWDGMAFRIEDSSCFVGIAPVYLSVSELKPIDGNLVGTYTIKVPLKSSKNDQGKIVLPLDVTVGELGANGGVLKGKAISEKDATSPNQIICEIRPQEDKLVRLAITTEHRTVKFTSRYEVVPVDG